MYEKQVKNDNAILLSKRIDFNTDSNIEIVDTVTS